MKRKLFNWSRRCQNALRARLQPGRKTSLASARGLGSQALAAGLQATELAKLHEQTLVNELLPGGPPGKRTALGTRERLEMVGGQLGGESAPGKGTRVLTQISFGKIAGAGKSKNLSTAANA